MDAERQIEEMWHEDAKLLNLLFAGAGAAAFFIHVLAVRHALLLRSSRTTMIFPTLTRLYRIRCPRIDFGPPL
jgi:hypothetical protein